MAAADTSKPGSNLPEYSVGDLARAIKRRIEESFGLVRVRGEISQPKLHTSGHLYLRLKDDNSVIEAVCWRNTVVRLGLRPEDGMEVICTGRLTTYPGRSQYQLVIEAMELAGEGALLKMLEERKRRLAADGLFDSARKRKLPYLPGVIGVITSPTGAVIRDILHRLADRFPRRVLVWPVAVQGEQAAAQVAAAIAGFNRLNPAGRVPRPDLLIVARGGGSLEDLMPFNEEIVVRATVASVIPVIAAVGHETDVTLIDLAADLRAPTPTAAAEFAVPERGKLLVQLIDLERRRLGAAERLLGERRLRIRGLARGLGDPADWLAAAGQRLDDRSERLQRAIESRLQRASTRLGQLGGALRHPREVLAAAQAHLAAEARALAACLRHRLTGAAVRLAPLAGRLSTEGLGRRQEEGQRRCRELSARLDRTGRQAVAEPAFRLESLGRRLESLSYRSVLRRGYAVVRDQDGHPVAAAADTANDQRVTLEFHDATVAARIGGPGPEPDRRPPRTRSRKPTQPSLL